ncbi:MAG: hypothetical protein ABSF60_16540 [Verrucomicrobiota bacterium]
MPKYYAEVLSADAQILPSTANPKDGTIDVVWYSGAPVPRIDRATGEPYMLQLDMQGCRFDRLNNGAPVFDNHLSGDDFKSLMAGKVGTRAQVGVVRRAWPNGDKGMATLQFDLGNEDGAEMFRKASAGILQNLSFGTFVYKREKVDARAEGMPEGKPPYMNDKEIGMFKATDWEPFEISPCTVPADFNTCFLSAQPDDSLRATSPQKEKPAMEQVPTQDAGAEDRTNEQDLAAAREQAVTVERERVSEIESLRATATKYSIDGAVISQFIGKGISADQARKELFAQLAEKGELNLHGDQFPIRGEGGGSGTRDGMEQRLACMQMALLLRADGRFFMARRRDHNGNDLGEYLDGCGPEQHKRAADMAREYRNFKLIDMAKEYLAFKGVNPRGMDVTRIADLALQGPSRGPEFFMGGAESTSDFPAILANVANKTLRQGYEAYPRTFQPFCRQVTAQDFKPINRVMLADAPTLQPLNEKGEYHRANLTDNNINYSLGTYGEIVALTRKVIINDDLQAFTRVPALLGVAAAQLESNTVWGIITSNPAALYAGDKNSTALFHANHGNLLTGAASSIDNTVQNAVPLTALGKARGAMRLQKGPQGTPLNLIPRFIAVPTALETYMLQLVYPINIASADATRVVPEWVRSLVPVVEPRLDAATNGTTAWYLIADPAQIDTAEYCYLEGQQGVYIETKQGFEVDGVEIKARMDFGAAALDFRGLQKNAGA